MRGIGYYNSPVGLIRIVSHDNAISQVFFVSEKSQEEITSGAVQQCQDELDEYFYRGRKFFSVELDLRGTEFQRRVWSELLTIPFGKTISYEALAIRIGDIKAIRAAALATGQNPIGIIVPCHRVIGKSGDLTGYGGGLEVKEWLLYHEGSLLKQLNLF
jgi:methylated-DNA-[protein]-cysteine S-methyltransferase